MSMSNVVVRDAQQGDEPLVVDLIQEMAAGDGGSSPVTAAFVTSYLSNPGSGILLAELEGEVAGLLSYSVRPDLYHAAPAALAEELVVHAPFRGRGVGSALLQAFLARMAEVGCAEVAIGVMPDNQVAQRLYRAHGLVEEAVLLERHL
jgi:ribosomal protein S18 acetylase RimI-like enzyme